MASQATTISATTVEQLLGRVLLASGTALDGGAPVHGLDRLALAQQPAAQTEQGVLETGIKAIDLYAPIPRGGLVAVVGGSGVGKVVITTELIRRAVDRRGACAVWAARSYPAYSLNEIVGENRAAGIDEATLVIGAEHTDSPEQQAQAGRCALMIAQRLAECNREVVLVVDEALVTEDLVDAIAADGHDLTTLAWVNRELPPGEGVPPHLIVDAADSVIVLSRQLAARGIWPAFDSLRSRSRLLSDADAYGSAARRARALLREHENLDAGENVAVSGGLAGRARRLLRYQTQPFFVAEAFTARPGSYVARERSLRDVEALLAGAYDERPEADLTFTGELPE